MTYLIQSKELVCKNLLSKVNVCDKKIAEAEKLQSFEDIKQAYLTQKILLQRLERVVTQ